MKNAIRKTAGEIRKYDWIGVGGTAKRPERFAKVRSVWNGEAFGGTAGSIAVFTDGTVGRVFHAFTSADAPIWIAR